MPAAGKGAVPKAALPALLTAPLAERYLDALAKTGFDLLDPGWSAVRPRPVLLTWAVIAGTVLTRSPHLRALRAA